LQERVKTFDDTITKLVEVDPKFYKTIIGSSGATLQKIVLDAGGPEDRRMMNRIVVFPKPGSESKEIRLEGQKAVVEKVEKAILSLVSERDGQITTSIDVAPEKHRLLIGTGGTIRRKIEEEFKVEIDIPKQTVSGPERSMVKVTGQPASVEKAKAHIEKLTKEHETETIQVPRTYHHVVSDEGSLFRRLRNDHGVLVDHAGQKPPPRPAAVNASRSRANGGTAMPLITDDASAASTSHSWELVDAHAATTAEDKTATIPWVLRGNAEKLALARQIVEQAVENASKPTCTGYLILSDPKLYRFVIGPGGSTINGIRTKTGTQIQVPRQGSESEAIEVKGQTEGVEQAKELILEAIQNGAGGAGAGGARRRRD
jgi:rRNA processing protein Krr1/Pno1